MAEFLGDLERTSLPRVISCLVFCYIFIILCCLPKYTVNSRNSAVQCFTVYQFIVLCSTNYIGTSETKLESFELALSIDFIKSYFLLLCYDTVPCFSELLLFSFGVTLLQKIRNKSEPGVAGTSHSLKNAELSRKVASSVSSELLKLRGYSIGFSDTSVV